MILQALKEYYDRKAELPRDGWEKKGIPFLLVIDESGGFVCLEDTRQTNGKQLRAKDFVVPSLGEKKGNGIKANLFWENLEYLLGVPIAAEGRQRDSRRVALQHQEFCRRVNAVPGKSRTLLAVRAFLSAIDLSTIGQDPLWPTVVELNQSVLLALRGVGPVTDDAELRAEIDRSRTVKGSIGRCLVSGEQDEITALEPPIRGVRDANPTGASLVSVNNKVNNGKNAGATPAFASFLKEQGANSPIGKKASFAYTTALNSLLGKDSRQRMQVGDATTVFWASKPCGLEEGMADIFGDPPRDDPDRQTEAVRALYRSIESGAYAEDKGDTRFYVLGLAPNAARIAVRFWIADTVAHMAGCIWQHFQDTAIVHGPKDRDSISLFRLLVSIAVQGKAENIPPNLGGDTMRAILKGLPYPLTLLQAAVRRVRAEREVTHPRAALIKACVNRETRRSNTNREEELTVSLDENNTNIGYRLGRLFATLEKIQQDASPGINATIRDRFYGAASSTPVTVFGSLMRLSNHNLSKLEKEKPGLAVVRKQLLGEVMSAVPDFPSHLALADQGRFAIGYYHQTQKFFEKKADKTNKEEQQQ